MKLPVLSGMQAAKALQKIGYGIDHISSHLILRNDQPPFKRLTVPKHREVAKGTLRAIIQQAGLTQERFYELL